jgi:hypothetical protein
MPKRIPKSLLRILVDLPVDEAPSSALVLKLVPQQTCHPEQPNPLSASYVCNEPVLDSQQ